MPHETIQEILRAALRCHQAGQLADAERGYREVLARQANHPEALHNLGVLALQSRHAEAGEELIRRAIAVNPGDPIYHMSLAGAASSAGRLEEAVASYRRAVQLSPQSPDFQCTLGLALLNGGQFDEAIAVFHRAIELRPSSGEFHYNLGVALYGKGERKAAIAAYGQALQLRPDSWQARHNLALALAEDGQLEAAVAGFQQVLAVRPNDGYVLNNLGNAYKTMGQVQEALDCYERAIAIDPANVGWHSNRLLTLHFHTGHDAEHIFKQHRAWPALCGFTPAATVASHGNDPSPDRRLRIGYVSSDFVEHSVAYFVEDLLAHHDAAQVEIFCYSGARRPDQVTDHLRQYAHHWHEIARQGDDRAAEQIRRDRIDILVDLSGHTSGNRIPLFARKPAPVQVTYLGYPDTTGLEAIDYRLSDALADPPGSERYCVEKLVRLPGSFLCFHPSLAAPPVAPPPVLSRARITFGSFNMAAKINEEVVSAWSEILRRTENTRLLIKNYGLREPAARQRLTRTFTSGGVDPGRLDVRATTSARQDHLGLYGEVDIALDTFPYNGTATTCEALWMGVPVVTLAGQSHMSRVGLSLLTNVGLGEFVAAATEQYVRIASDLAADLPRLSALRAGLRERMRHSPLMDGKGLARHIELAYRRMWRNWCELR